MTRVKKVKTYSKSNSSTVNNSVNAFNALFAKNMTKRLIGKNKRKRNFLIKELPARPRCESLLVDDSLQVSTEDTFDKLFRKKVQVEGAEQKEDTKNSHKTNSHENVMKSKSFFSQTSTFHSPIMTRSQKKSVSVTENTNTQITIPDKTKGSSNPYQYRLNAPTIDGIDGSLEIEMVRKKPEMSSSYLASTSKDKTNISLNNIFTKTFRERQFIHSSTPLAPQKFQKKIINHTISPIKNLSCLVKKSFEEIRKWDSKFPVVDESKWCPVIEPMKEPIKEGSPEDTDCFHGFSRIEQSKYTEDTLDDISENILCNPNPRMSFITLRRRQIPKTNRKKVKGKWQSKSQSSSNNYIISLDTFNSFEVEKNSSSKEIKSTVDQSSFKELGEEIVSELVGSQMSDVLRDNKLEPPLNSFSRSQKRFTDSSLMLNNASNIKSCKSDNDTFRTSKDMIINVTRMKTLYNSSSKVFSFTEFENFHSKNNIFRDESANNTVENTSIINTMQDRKELVVNVTKKDIITSMDFENFYSRNISIEKLNYEDELPNHQDAKELVVNISRKKFSEINDKSKKELIVNVTQNIFEDFYTKNYSFDHNSDVTGAMESLGKGSSDFLSDNSNNHDGTSLIESSYVEPARKMNKISSHTQVDESLGGKKDEVVPVLMNSSENVCLKKSTSEKTEVHCIDLTESLDESVKQQLPPTDIISQKIPTWNSSDIIESSVLESSQRDNDVFKVPMVLNTRKGPPKTVLLKAGKSWRRSLSIYKRSSISFTTGREGKKTSGNEIVPGPSNQKNKRISIKILPLQDSPLYKNGRKTTVLDNYAVNTSGYVPDQILEGNLENSLRCLSLRRSTLVQDSLPVTAREVVLRRCGQTEPIRFSECYPQSALHHCQKIGEGVYGEVFLYRNPAGGTSVMKVIPIEGDQIVNGERQKKFEEILSEVIIAKELSDLRNNKENATSTFSLVQKVHCVQGHYPEKLLDLWELYEETRGSENDCPDLFRDDQLYVVLELENAGRDLEAFVFNNAQQAYAMFKQVAFGLAVAEEELRFEHRDLHWGNILLNTVDKNKMIEYCLGGEKYFVSSRGVVATIIDFTLSRIEYDGVVIFNDLGLDPDLFTAEGDYQFEIYRLMQDKNKNNWQGFEPYSNLLWLHYTLDKIVTALRYKNASSKTHKDNLLKMKQLSKEILTYKSVKDFVLNAPL